LIIDTHIHLCDEKYDTDRAEMLDRARAAGIGKFVNIGAEIGECRKVVKFSGDGVYSAVGIHPHNIAELSEDVYGELGDYLKNNVNIVALGEIGLDYSKGKDEKAAQFEAFKKMLGLAAKFDRPVVIHSRNAHADVAVILKEYGPARRGIIHCFSGDYDAGRMFAEMGYVLGIGGVITFSNAPGLRGAVEKMPLEWLVLETDAPWLAPQQHRGQRNEASYIRNAAWKIAELKGIPVEEVERVTTSTAERILGI
jgi:TatD DNase family protein